MKNAYDYFLKTDWSIVLKDVSTAASENYWTSDAAQPTTTIKTRFIPQYFNNFASWTQDSG